MRPAAQDALLTLIVHCACPLAAMGHPVVYLNLDKDMPKTCSYCGLRYYNANHH